jgi:hypothetical protein
MKRILMLWALLLAGSPFAAAQSLEEINTPTVANLDEVAPFHEGLAAVRRGNQWGFINKSGELVIDFRSDLVWNQNPEPDVTGVKAIPYPRFSDGRCPITATKEEGIPFYGFIDTSGKTVIEPDYLNITEFTNGMAVGIFFQKTFRGKNNFQLNIYDYTFTEGIINPAGEMTWPLTERKNIMMKPSRYEMPEIKARILEQKVIAVETSPEQWEIRKIQR